MESSEITASGPEIAGKPEVQENRKAILDGVRAIAGKVTTEYPQINGNGKLDYYFTGSAAAMLLAQADHFSPLEDSRLPEVVPGAEVPLSDQARTKLSNIARKIGDLDIAVLPDYEASYIAAMQEQDPADAAAYEEARKGWIHKGLYATLPEGVSDAAMGEVIRVDVAAGDEPARISIDGQEFYITDPKAMLEHKAFQMIREFSNHTNKDKLINDFSVLIEGLSIIYPREELVRSIHDLFIDQPNVAIPTYHPLFDATSRAFFEEVVASDDNAEYLEDLEMGPERSMGMLNILRSYQGSEAKEDIVAFINDHKEDLDRRDVSPNDSNNRQLVADYIRQHPAQHEAFLAEHNLTVNTVPEWIETNPWAVKEYGRGIPREVGVIWEPEKNYYLDILAELDETNIAQELSVLERVIDIPPRHPKLPGGYEVKAIFQSKVAQRPDTRKALFSVLDAALSRFDLERTRDFLRELNKASRAPFERREEEVDEADQIKQVRECFGRFDVPFQIAA